MAPFLILSKYVDCHRGFCLKFVYSKKVLRGHLWDKEKVAL